MDSLSNYHPDIYFRHNDEFYEFSNNIPPPIWGAHQLQGSAEMLAGMTSSFSMPPYPSSGMVLPEGFNMASSYEALAPNHLSHNGCYYDNVLEMMKLEEYYSDGPNFEPNFGATGVCPLIDHHPQLNNKSADDDWGCKVHDQTGLAMEEPSMKVGKYSAEERKDRILRYLKKRSQRNFNKTIKYACRKTLADKRVRVRGRFARNNELLCEGGDKEVTKMNNHSDNLLEERGFYDDDIIKIKNDEEEWLQEAMASLMYLPYVTG